MSKTVNVKHKPIYVKWHDHYAHKDNWGKGDYSDVNDSMTCETVGFKVAESKMSIHVALNRCFKKDNMTDTSETICILKSCIVKKRFLK